MLGFERWAHPTVGDGAHARAREGIAASLLLGDAQGLREHVAIAQLPERDGGTQQTVERVFTARAEERGDIGLARPRETVAAVTAGLGEPARRVTHREHAFPPAAAEGGGVRLE